MKRELPGLDDGQRLYLGAAVFVGGAAALVLEIVGTRLISPYYGSSLYTWSALITVTLVALACGYRLGGRAAEGNPGLALFARLLGLAALAAACVPVLRTPVLKLTGPLGVQIGALLSAALLVAPTLSLLGALGPVAIRLSTSSLGEVGRKAGDVYSLSTAGSVVGALGTGFVLVPNLPLTVILYGLAAVLLALSAWGSGLSAKKVPWRPLAAATAALALAFWPRPEAASNLLWSKESRYGQIRVLDADGRRYLFVDGTTQSVARIPDGRGEAGPLETESSYLRSLEWAALSARDGGRALFIGSGAGLLPGVLERRYRIPSDVVELDPHMLEAARRFFGFRPEGAEGGETFVEDGRRFLERSGRMYSLIFLDAFGAETPPHHLFTREAFAAARRRLEPGGILAVNLVSLVTSPGDEPWLAVMKTLSEAFPNVRAFLGSEPYHGLANVVFFASDAPLRDREFQAARPEIRADLERMKANELRADLGRLARLPSLRDDFAPLESLLTKTALEWRKSIRMTAEPVLLQ